MVGGVGPVDRSRVISDSEEFLVDSGRMSICELRERSECKPEGGFLIHI